MRRPASRPDLVGNIAGGIGDNRKIVPQAAHIVECGRAHLRNRFDLIAILSHKRLEAVCIFREPFAGAPTERFQFARLSGEKFARKAQLAVHH